MDERKNNILFLEQFGNHIGGGQIILLGILEYLQKTNQWNVFVSLPEEGIFTDLLRNKGFECIITPMVKHSMQTSFFIDISRYSITSIRSAYKLSKLIKKHKIKIIYCNGGRTFMSSILLSLIHPVSLYWHIHLILDSRQKKMVTTFGRTSRVKRLIAVSEAARNAFNGSLVYFKTDVIPNWVRPEFLSTPITPIQQQRNHPIKIAVIGLISREKGQTTLLETLNSCQKPLPIELTFAGSIHPEDSEHKKRFESLVDHMINEGWKVNIEGFKSNIVDLLDNIDFLLIPSLAAESFGLTAIEAMSRNVVVIANNVGALPEIIDHGVNGFLYRSDSPESLINLFLKIINNKLCLTDIRNNGRRKVADNYHPEKQIKKISYLIKQSISETINILHLNGISDVTHDPQQMYWLMQFINKKKFSFSVVCPDDPTVYSPLKNIDHISVFPIDLRRIKPTKIIPLIRLVKARNIQLVFSKGKIAGFWGRFLKILCPKLKVIHQFDNIHYKHFSKIYQVLYKYYETAFSLLSNRLIFVSLSELNEAKFDFKINNEKLSVINNGAQTYVETQFEAAEYRKQLNLPLSMFIGVAFTGFSHKKNSDFLLDIIEKTKYHSTPIHFVIFLTENDGKGKKFLEEIERRNISDMITLNRQTKDIYPWLFASDFYIATAEREDLPLSLLDIRSTGLPIVASDVFGNDNLVSEKTGILITSGDLEQFHEAIIKLYKDKKLRLNMVEDTKRFVENIQSIQALVQSHEKLYSNLLSGKNAFKKNNIRKTKSNKVLIDARLIKGSGISTYISNLLNKYSKINHQLDIDILVNNISQLKSNPNINEKYNAHLFNKKIYSLSEQIFLPSIMKKKNILHIPHYNAPLAYKGVLIVTIHDICHYVMKQFFPGIPKRLYSSVFLNKILNKANQVIAVSQFTKNEIQKYFRIPEEKIEVIHNGIDPYFYRRSNEEVEKLKQTYGLPCDYLLYVGNIRPHKNVAGLVKGYAYACKQDRSIPPLVLCGVCQSGYDVFKELADLSVSEKEFIRNRVLFTGYFKYQDLPALYSGASSFLYLSLYEGFGIPPLEAMACGTPVIVSSTSALPEICGNSAFQVDPFNLDEISLAIRTTLYEKNDVDTLNKIASKRVKRYSWSTSAQKHLAVYKKWLN